MEAGLEPRRHRGTEVRPRAAQFKIKKAKLKRGGKQTSRGDTETGNFLGYKANSITTDDTDDTDPSTQDTEARRGESRPPGTVRGGCSHRQVHGSEFQGDFASKAGAGRPQFRVLCRQTQTQHSFTATRTEITAGRRCNRKDQPRMTRMTRISEYLASKRHKSRKPDEPPTSESFSRPPWISPASAGKILTRLIDATH